MKATLRISLSLILIFSSTAQADVLTLEKAIESAHAKSPEIRALENQYDSASAKKRQALFFAEPTLSIGFADMVEPFHLNQPASTIFQFTQPVGFPGRALLNNSALADQAEAVHQQLQAMKLQVSANVKQAYYALALAQKNRQLNSEQKAIFERILAIARRRYESGAITQVDYLNAQLALLSNENDLTDLESAERLSRAQLNILLENPPADKIEVKSIEMVYHDPIRIEEALPRMLEKRAEVQAARHQATAAGKTAKLAWMSILPDFQLVAGSTIYNVPTASPLAGSTMETHTYMAAIQFTVPLWAILNERETILGAGHDQAAAEANLDAVFNQSKIALETAVENVNSLRTKIQNYEKHMLPLAQQSFNLALINYSAGKIDFVTLTEAASAWRAVKRDYSSAIVNYMANYTTYGQLTGEDY